MKEEVPQLENKMPLKRRLLKGLGLSLWVVVSFLVANLLVGLIFGFLFQIKLLDPSGAVDSPVLMASLAALVFVLTLLIVIGVPYALRGSRTTKEELGLTRLPNWVDIILAPASFVAYMFVAGAFLLVITNVFPSFNADEVQDVGFKNLTNYLEYALAFATLVIIAPVAEEVLFRGYLYGKLRKIMPVIGAVLISAIVFSALHLSFDGNSEGDGLAVTQWNVALNILPLAIILALLREKTGSIWASILLHMLKNGVAFYLLFINPSILSTIGG